MGTSYVLLKFALFLWFLCPSFAAPAQRTPIVDLGYARYKGTSDPASGYDTYFGMHFAAPPVGDLRFRAPQPPLSSPHKLVDASNNSYPGTVCPQGFVSGRPLGVVDLSIIPISEDCLTLTVYAPFPTTHDYTRGFPVVVYFHDGAYVRGDHSYDHPQRWLDLADKDVVLVVPNYRLGLFGFLAGEEVHKDGDLNAGLLDQQFALKWVQKHIAKFGGDKSRVTIWGQSAGGGSVIQHIISNPLYPGNNGLFTNAVANSPFMSSQYLYSDTVPTSHYKTVLNATGCHDQGLACLRKLSTQTLEQANLEICDAGFFGTLPWAPVLEPKGGYVDTRPSVALLNSNRKLNTQRVLTTHLSWEALRLVDPSKTNGNITEYVHKLQPALSPAQVAKVISLYPSSDYSSEQERTASIYQDPDFICSSYWLAMSFSGRAYKGIWDIPPSTHGQDRDYWLYPGDYHTLPSPETFENYVGGIVSFVRSGDANLFRLNREPGQSNQLEWPLFDQGTEKGLVFDLADDGVGSKVEARSIDRKLKERCEMWLSLADVIAQ